MKIGDREIDPYKHPPYIIAEASCNHGGDINRVYELIDAAKSCGADAIKFQCYTADTITIDSDRPEFTIKDGPWKGRRLYDLYKKTETPFWMFPKIKERAERVGIHWFASVFDKTSVDLMVQLDAPAVKIASFEITDLPLIRYAAATGKPLLISKGMASADDIVRAGDAAGRNFMFLECTSGYPTPFDDVGLHAMWGMRGISDHTAGDVVPIAATALRTAVIEKHFKLFWHQDTEDSAFSLDEVDFASMVGRVKNAWAALQSRSHRSEAGHHDLRRSLYAVADIKAGDVFTDASVRSIRPGGGLEPGKIDKIVGRVATRDVARGEPMDMDMVAPG